MGYKFDPNCMSTNGASYSAKKIYLNNGKDFDIVFRDTAGQERYKALTKFFVKDSDCIILGYDITRRESFENIKTFWYDFSKDNSGTDLIYIVGNKIDLYDYEQVAENEALKYCEENNIRYFGISCLTTEGIQKLLDDLVDQLIKNININK